MRGSGLVLVMGERLWAQLDAVAQWGQDVDRVCLLMAHGDDEDGGSAERFEQFLATHLPSTSVQRLGPVNDDDPLEVAEVVRLATSGGGPWTLDASGGSRLMFAGMLLAAQDPRCRLVYRAANGPWYGLEAGGARLLDDLRPCALDRYPVADLLAVTWQDGDRTARVAATTIEGPIRRAADKAVARSDLRWAQDFWKAVSEVQRRDRSADAGALFEHYVVALLHALGFEAEDLTLGVTLKDTDVTLQEVDVVVNSAGWLHVIDCKLSSARRRRQHHAVPLGTQIREAFATKRHIGDGGDQFLLLRPFLVIPEEFRDLCEEYDVTVIDKVVLMGRSLPDVLATRLQAPSKRLSGGRS